MSQAEKQLFDSLWTGYFFQIKRFDDFGTEFIPTPDEGSMVVASKATPGISLTESIAIGNEIERTIKSFPEVKSVVTNLATQSMGEYKSTPTSRLVGDAERKQLQEAGVLRSVRSISASNI